MNIYEELVELLKTNSNYLSNDGKLLKAKVFEDVYNIDSDLLELLLSNEQIKSSFFKEVKGMLVFDKEQFNLFLNSTEYLEDSYTKYTNKIGLATKNNIFFNQFDDVVLDFPYKDSYLLGGQTKDDDKKNEIFFNEVIARDEISSLLEPKVFTNTCRISKDSRDYTNIDFNDSDNLIIKGDNLIALSSILKRYEGKVKCIYIDPPYNTGNDSFNYNDSFNHSTWLVFMKNRLELARRLLRDDGVIFVQCDDNEQAYLKVLMDEIFGRSNFVANIPRITKKAGKSTGDISKNHDYILIYKRHYLVFNQLEINEEDYSHKDEFFSQRGPYKLNQTLDYDSLGYIETLDYPIDIAGKIFYPGGDEKKWVERKNGIVSTNDWAWRWRWKQSLFQFGLKNDFIVVKNNRIYTKTYTKAKISNGKDGYFIEYFQRGKNATSLDLVENLFSNDRSKKEQDQTFGKKVFNYSKPETVIEFILNISTKPGDLVLDFHLGSGTTCAVAHKMGRQYIGIEQMDYIEDITVERMKKVIDGEQGGISKAVNWTGGGSFVYTELLDNANSLVNKVLESNEDNILEIKEQIFNDKRIKPLVTKSDLSKYEEDFNNLSLEEQKKVLISLINKNKLYINYSEIDDETYNVSEEDKLFTKSFYEVF